MNQHNGVALRGRAGYGRILGGLDNAIALCMDLGLKAALRRSRFTRYREYIAQLRELITDDPLTPEVARELSANTDVYLAALADSWHLGQVAEKLKETESRVLKCKLRHVLGGPVLPSDEDADSNHARNILFELVLAGLLKDAGVRVALGDPDVTCEIEGSRIAFECKRLFSPRKLADRIREADALLRAKTTSGGVIAISISKLFTGSRIQPLPITGEEEGMEILSAWQAEVAGETESISAPLIDRDPVVGILFHADGIFRNDHADRFEFGEFWTGAYTRETNAFRKLQRAIDTWRSGD